MKELRKFDGRLPEDVKDWISAKPDVVELLQELQVSGHTLAQLRASFSRRRPSARRWPQALLRARKVPLIRQGRASSPQSSTMTSGV